RHQDQVQPRLHGKKRLQVGLPALVEVSHEEGEDGAQHQEHDQEHVGHGGDEIAAQPAPQYRGHRTHDAVPAAGAAPSPAAVMWRKTSSRRPLSSWISDTSKPCSRSNCCTGPRMRSPGFGNTVVRPSSGSTSMAATCGRRPNISCAMPLPGALNETAPW